MMALGRRHRALAVLLEITVLLCMPRFCLGQELPAPRKEVQPPFTPPPAEVGEKVLPISLPTALKLAQARGLDVAAASERINQALAQYDKAKVLWLPTILLGGDYFRHDGRFQDNFGSIFGSSRSNMMVGAGPSAIFALSDAIYEPLAAKQVLQARHASLQAASNDTMLAVARAYFDVQQARGELTGALKTVQLAEDVVTRAKNLVGGGLVPDVEATRARAELARRKQAVQTARERWRVAAAQLNRVLRLEPAALVEPLEPPSLEVSLVPPGHAVDELIAQALTGRPELAAQQALVQANLRRLKEEKVRPLIPSILFRGGSTNPTGTVGGGYFGGGPNSRLSDFNARMDLDVQVLWELQNLGLGNHARVHERKADHQLAVLELFRIQDQVAAEVADAYAQVRSAAARIGDAETGLKDAYESAGMNIEGMGQTKKAGNLLILVIRPQEAIAAVQTLTSAYSDYYGAVADYNRAQFRLYRALGNPAEMVLGKTCPEQSPSPQ